MFKLHFGRRRISHRCFPGSILYAIQLLLPSAVTGVLLILRHAHNLPSIARFYARKSCFLNASSQSSYQALTLAHESLSL